MPVDLPGIGIRLDGRLDPRIAMERAAIAEENGFAAIWFAENQFERGALPAAAACATITKRVRMGIGVFNPYNRHPSLIAMEIAALDELAQGRAALGIGSGIAAAVRRMGMGVDRPLGALRDAVHIVRGMLRGETVTHAGRVFSVSEVALGFKARRPDMPIYLAARGRQSLRLCGQVGDGLMLSNMCPPGFTEAAVAIIRAAAAESGRPAPAAVVQYVPCVVDPDGDAARRRVKSVLGGMVASFWALGQRVAAAKEALLASGIAEADFAVAAENLGRGEAAENVLDDRFVDQFAIAGTAEEFLAQAAVYGKAGVTELGLTFVGDRPAEEMEYLGGALRSRAGALDDRQAGKERQ